MYVVDYSESLGVVRSKGFQLAIKSTLILIAFTLFDGSDACHRRCGECGIRTWRDDVRLRLFDKRKKSYVATTRNENNN